MLAVLAHTQFGLLQLVYLLVNLFQTAVVRCAEILTSGRLCNTAQCTFVKLGVHRHVLPSDGGLDGHTGLTVTADAYRIDADAEAVGYLCRCLRIDVPAVVRTVGQQNNYFRLGLAVFHAVYRISQSQTDSRSVFNHPVFHGFE